MNVKRTFRPVLVLIITLGTVGSSASTAAAPPHPHTPTPPHSNTLSLPLPHAPSTPLADDPSPPAEPVKLIFIHHSCGENWLNDGDGGLGITLRDDNYFVSDTNYGWGPPDADLGYENIGDHTDIGHWYNWFVGPNSVTYATALYTESGQHSWYSRLATDPGGENEIVMFKSCYPNSHLGGNPADPPTGDPNPLRGQDAWSEHHTVANAKGIYNDLLTYFTTRQDKLFVVIAAPPRMESETDAAHAANARAFNDWLVNDWLDGYPHANVAVFDFYNVLTSNGGSTRTDDPNTNDEGWADGNHHRWLTAQSRVQCTQTVSNNYSAYWGGSGGGSHPTAAGNQKATAEFVPLLNVFYNRWRGGDGPSYTFTAVITPTNATPPITYTWSPQHLIGGQGTVSATYRWDTAGVYEISVEAENCGGTFTDTHTITIDGASPALSGASTGEPATAVHDNDAVAQQTMVFQDGVSPTAGYDGTRDVILANDLASNVTLGRTDHLETFFGEGEEHRRSLMRWDLSALPGGITINAATAELYRYGGDVENDMSIALHRVTREWTEGTGDFTPSPGGATWLTATTGVAWTTPGGDYDATVVDQTTLPAAMGNGWVRLGATAAVRTWVEDGQPNYGLLLRPLSGDYTYHYYHSREAVTPALRPRLVVTFTSGSALTNTVHLPLALRNYAPQPPTCPHPLTGVYISGPTGGSPAGTAPPGAMKPDD